MKNVWSFRPLTTALLGALVFIAGSVVLHAQTSESAIQSLLARARVLETSGRIELAAQDWQQVLLADPNNIDALAGLARSAMLGGSPALANVYLDRIKAMNPHAGQIDHALHDRPKPIAVHSSKRALERAGYNALNAKNLAEAEARFNTVLAGDSKNVSALAGMGYVRMQQSDFGGAISFLERARQNGARDKGLDATLKDARFRLIMDKGSTALKEKDLTTAQQQYCAALVMRPSNPDALEGLSGTLLKDLPAPQQAQSLTPKAGSSQEAYVPYVAPTQSRAISGSSATHGGPNARAAHNTASPRDLSPSHHPTSQPATYSFAQQYPRPRTMARIGPGQPPLSVPVPTPSITTPPCMPPDQPGAPTPPVASPADVNFVSRPDDLPPSPSTLFASWRTVSDAARTLAKK